MTLSPMSTNNKGPGLLEVLASGSDKLTTGAKGVSEWVLRNTLESKFGHAVATAFSKYAAMGMLRSNETADFFVRHPNLLYYGSVVPVVITGARALFSWKSEESNDTIDTIFDLADGAVGTISLLAAIGASDEFRVLGNTILTSIGKEPSLPMTGISAGPLIYTTIISYLSASPDKIVEVLNSAAKTAKSWVDTVGDLTGTLLLSGYISLVEKANDIAPVFTIADKHITYSGLLLALAGVEVFLDIFGKGTKSKLYDENMDWFFKPLYYVNRIFNAIEAYGGMVLFATGFGRAIAYAASHSPEVANYNIELMAAGILGILLADFPIKAGYQRLTSLVKSRTKLKLGKRDEGKNPVDKLPPDDETPTYLEELEDLLLKEDRKLARSVPRSLYRILNQGLEMIYDDHGEYTPDEYTAIVGQYEPVVMYLIDAMQHEYDRREEDREQFRETLRPWVYALHGEDDETYFDELFPMLEDDEINTDGEESYLDVLQGFIDTEKNLDRRLSPEITTCLELGLNLIYQNQADFEPQDYAALVSGHNIIVDYIIRHMQGMYAKTDAQDVFRDTVRPWVYAVHGEEVPAYFDKLFPVDEGIDLILSEDNFWPLLDRFRKYSKKNLEKSDIEFQDDLELALKYIAVEEEKEKKQTARFIANAIEAVEAKQYALDLLVHWELLDLRYGEKAGDEEIILGDLLATNLHTLDFIDYQNHVVSKIQTDYVSKTPEDILSQIGENKDIRDISIYLLSSKKVYNQVLKYFMDEQEKMTEVYNQAVLIFEQIHFVHYKKDFFEHTKLAKPKLE